MAIFRYKDAYLLYEADRGYRNLLSHEWETSPVDAVAAYVGRNPQERGDFITLAKRINDFWSAQAADQPLPAFEEVTFDQ